jgi:hypothetical protein
VAKSSQNKDQLLENELRAFCAVHLSKIRIVLGITKEHDAMVKTAAKFRTLALLALFGSATCGQPPPPLEGETLSPAATTPLPPTFEPLSPSAYTAKVKSLMTGLSVTDAEARAVMVDPAALRGLIDTWMATPEFQLRLHRFFQNSFQQVQVNSASFFEQFNENIINTRLLANLLDSFALTALQQTFREDRPFTQTVTTDSYMLTPPLATFLAYLDNRHINDLQRASDYTLAAIKDFTLTLSHSSGPIPIEQSLQLGGPKFMNWYLPDVVPMGCTDPLVYKGSTVRVYQYLFGIVGATTAVGGCPTGINITAPTFVEADYSAWRMVRIRTPRAGEATTPFYDLRAMRSANELVLRVPRIGFFSTPAFFANWSTNASNQARVTMNQTLIVALGRSFDDSNSTVPLTRPILDSDKAHAQDPACYGCHKTLDPMRQVFRQAYTLFSHEQLDPTQRANYGVFAVDGVTRPVSSPAELATALVEHPRFATAWTQKLCYWANSAPCSETDPEFVRIAATFESSGFKLKTLLGELLSSPLVTGARQTQTFEDQGQTISVTRRDQFCLGLSSRLGVPNLCGLGRAPGLVQLVPSDGYSRGATAPVLATAPSLFYRAATEQLCRTFADQVVDVTGRRYSSKMVVSAIDDMVQTVMGVVPSDPRHARLRSILFEHHGKAVKTAGITATDALKSTFVLACSAPSSVSIGL